MNEQTIWDYLSDKLNNAYGVAGLMGNLYAESALNPRNLQQSYEKKLGYTDDSYTNAVDSGTYTNFIHDSAGYGMAQWTYWSRKEKLLKFAQKRGDSIGDLNMQLDYLWEELNAYKGIVDSLKAAKSVREASDIILTQYEKPANQSDSVKVKRAEYGMNYYDKYGGERVNYDKYLYSTGIHYISNSGQDENKSYHGGKVGDQSGHEWELKAWYSRPWGVVLRYPDAAVGLKIAELAIAAALNNKIGYDQWQRTTYWQQLQKAGYDPSKITVPCEADCTAGVTANVKAVGFIMGIPALSSLPIDTYSGNMRSRFVAAGFKALTDSKYITSDKYLLPGDILLYVNHHAATNITYGSKVRQNTNIILTKGDKGSEVKAMQEKLLEWNPDCLPKYGADGDYGTETANAVKAFQDASGLAVTGVYDAETEKYLAHWTGCNGDSCPLAYILITGNSVNIRTAPGTNGKILGVAHKGDRIPYQGEVNTVNDYPWYLVEYDNQNAWVSGKYSKVEG